MNIDKKNIRVSVIMPVYNAAKYLPVAIESILCQDMRDFELLLIDDGSTDGSSAICDSYADKDNRVIVVHQENKGICAARNKGIEMASGEYVAFADHDDEYLHNLLSHVYEKAKSEDADIVKYGMHEYVLKNDNVVKERDVKMKEIVLNKDDIRSRFWSLLNEDVLTCVWDGIYRRSLLLENNIRFDTIYKVGGEDIDFLLKVICFTNKMVGMSDTFYIHNLRLGRSTSAKFNKQIFPTTHHLPTSVVSATKKMNIAESRSDLVKWIANRYLSTIGIHLAMGRNFLHRNERMAELYKMKDNEILPSDFYKLSILEIKKLPIKVALPYVFMKYGLYSLFLLMFDVREYLINKRK